MTSKHFVKPWDVRFADAMLVATAAVMGVTSASLAYVGSDEISIFVAGGSVPWSGRPEKLASIPAAYAAVAFARAASVECDLAFDGRSMIATGPAAADYLRDRRSAAKRNAISDVCYWNLRCAGATRRAATRQLDGLSLTERFAFLEAAGIELSDRQVFGTLRRKTQLLDATTASLHEASEELAKLSEPLR